jgi:hypothetical protein
VKVCALYLNWIMISDTYDGTFLGTDHNGLIPNSKWETRAPDVIIRSFELRHSFDIRHTDFVIRNSSLSTARHVGCYGACDLTLWTRMPDSSTPELIVG